MERTATEEASSAARAPADWADHHSRFIGLRGTGEGHASQGQRGRGRSRSPERGRRSELSALRSAQLLGELAGCVQLLDALGRSQADALAQLAGALRELWAIGDRRRDVSLRLREIHAELARRVVEAEPSEASS